ncbi:rho GTPase-activating protein SYDE1-like [Xyrauchen texanus]|uniref:rho GTPase-activating protein SYDE1-like n=1 Tax=Xyrauchen texanus TaxID=154827 RepID=UPI00224238DF|nr:rho GTPase-activating protein SYDE1-like [Xyrauchen texanus]
MAEPLLRRTFSKLRGKERFRRKTDPKLTELTGKVDLIPSSSTSASTSGQAETELSVVEDCARRSQITVSKKQNWAKLPSTCRDPASAELCPRLVYGHQDWDLCSGKSEVSNQTCSQRTLSDDGLKRKLNDLELEFGCPRTPCDAIDAGLLELSPASTAYTEACVSSSPVKISGQGAYLQHLDRSSRAWVLSTGKPQASEESLLTRITEWRQGPNADGNIWYNPIPEEDDTRSGGGVDLEKYGDPWRRRESTNEKRDQKCSQGSTLASSDLVGLQSENVISACGGNSDSPGVPKKNLEEGGSGGSVIDRIKSPGTVRRLSMKMRKFPELRRKLSLRSSRNQRHGPGQANASSAPGLSDEASPPNVCKESSNVISKYHLDSSAPARPRRRSSRTRSASKGGYLSDGDSPELLPKQGSGQGSKGSPTTPPHCGISDSLAVADTESFRLYSLADQPRCAQRLSGLLTVHLLGIEELLRSPRSDTTKEVFCAIQVDGVTRARTALLTCRGACLPLNHTFNLELERARLLKLVILTATAANANNGSCVPTAPARNRVCCLGAVAIPSLFKASRSQQLCVRLEPRGLLYVKLTLLEHFVTPFPRLNDLHPPTVFGVELRQLVDKEASALKVPLIIQKCVSEIERRGLRVVGLYRLCGSAAVKKELRDLFERDSAAVTLNDELYPDVNVITGILKDYLRELPSPLITRTLYEVVLDAMTVRPACRNDNDAPRSENTVALLQCLPEAERATLSFLLDHLSLVASYSDSNRMTCQNLAVCFGPVLLTPTQESWQAGLTAPCSGALMGTTSSRGGRSFAHSEEIASAVDFKRHIEALHYLLQLWPVPKERVTDDSDQSRFTADALAALTSQNSSMRRAQRAPLRVELPSAQDAVVVSRRGRGRLESPSCNRYAGDWSVCGRDIPSNDEVDYDEVAGSESDEDLERRTKKRDVWTSPDGLYADDFALDFDAPFTCRLSLKDFDTLISDLERELAKQINICL